MPGLARLTVGMPLYRNARTIVRALTSLQRQTFTDFRVILSDDCSTDDTVAIVERFAREDRRLQLVRQPRNLLYGNFRYVLEQADTELFMWGPGDDWWEPTFMERCIAKLDSEPEAVCAVSQVVMHPDEGAPYLSPATYPLTGAPDRNIARYLTDVGDNSRMYGVYPTAVAQRCFPERDFFAFDWAFCALTLLHGTYVRVEEPLMHREVTPPGRYVEYVRRDNAGAASHWFPLLPLSRRLLRERVLRRNRHVLRALLATNADQHRQYVARYHPRLQRFYQGLGRSAASAH